MLKVYGSYDCEHCMDIHTGLMLMNIAHDFLDANVEPHKNLLDELAVERLPLVQLIDEEGNVAWQKSGSVTLRDIKRETERTARKSGEPS